MSNEPAKPDGNRRRPNVIVFFTDQQRWDSMGAHGNPLGLTPHLDRLAREGTFLAGACTPQPICGPARACFQTGLHATAHGTFINPIPLNPELPTLAGLFAAAGYRTGYIGKWHLGPSDCAGPVAPEYRGGYQDWLASNLLEMVSGPCDCRVHDGDGREVRLPGYRSDAITDAAIRYVDCHADEPFFLFVSQLEPHHQNQVDGCPAPIGGDCPDPWMPPDLRALGGNAARSLPGYWGMIRRLDEGFGRLLDALESRGLRDDTVVLFTSDHGCHFKTRNGEYKRSCHESSVRIPAVLAGPGFDGGGGIRRPVSLLDFPPTLLTAAGIEPPEDWHGRPLQPLLGGRDAPNWPREVFIQLSEAELGRALRTERWKYGVVDATGRDPVTDDHSSAYLETHLYDLKYDPYELDNLAGLESHREVADDLRARLLRQIRRIERREPEIRPASPRDGGQRRPLP